MPREETATDYRTESIVAQSSRVFGPIAGPHHQCHRTAQIVFSFRGILPSATVSVVLNAGREIAIMASAADEIVEMITDRISATGSALQLSEPLNNLGLDSLKVVELIFDIEEKFDINLPVNANMDIESKTVGDLIQAVDQLVAAKAKPN